MESFIPFLTKLIGNYKIAFGDGKLVVLSVIHDASLTATVVINDGTDQFDVNIGVMVSNVEYDMSQNRFIFSGENTLAFMDSDSKITIEKSIDDAFYVIPSNELIYCTPNAIIGKHFKVLCQCDGALLDSLRGKIIIRCLDASNILREFDITTREIKPIDDGGNRMIYISSNRRVITNFEPSFLDQTSSYSIDGLLTQFSRDGVILTAPDGLKIINFQFAL